MMQALHISWDEIHEKSLQLAKTLSAMGPWQGIVGISRSGLIPATIIAMEMEIRLLETVCVSSYDHQVQREAQILKSPFKDVKSGQGWVVIDDLVDTGQTAQLIRKLLPDAYFATLYAKEEGKPFVDSFVTEVPQTTWIYFPWDPKA